MNNKSLREVAPVPIELVSHEDSSESQVLMTNVRVGDYIIVKGQSGARYVVWTVVVETTRNRIVTRKRFSEFECLRSELLTAFPDRVMEIPPLEKRWWDNMNTEFLQRRQRSLHFFATSVFLNPAFARSQLVKQFILS